MAIDLETTEADAESIGWLNADDPLLDADADDSDGANGTDPWVALLPSLDPTVMGWKDRAWYLDPAHVGRLFDRNGNAGPTIWVDGRVVGGWVQRPDGQLATELLEPLTPDEQQRLHIEIQRLQEFIGETRFRVRFPSRNQPELLADAGG